DFGVPANDDAIKSIKLLMSIMADAIVETKGGILQDAYQEGEIEDDITMEDVIINVEKHAEEQEKRRRARNEEKNNRFNNRGPRRYNSERRYIGKKEEAPAEAKAEETPAAAPVVEEVKEEVKEEVAE
ncbi:MAG: 30S ribosomal protein S2, partial [Erysipelotrichaceae bacterium]|nr:30S ribosomal protein S2 [Erysipelotrichaceae bacterium]